MASCTRFPVQFDRARATLDRPMLTLAFADIVSATLAHVRDGQCLEYDDATNTARWNVVDLG